MKERDFYKAMSLLKAEEAIWRELGNVSKQVLSLIQQVAILKTNGSRDEAMVYATIARHLAESHGLIERLDLLKLVLDGKS